MICITFLFNATFAMYEDDSTKYTSAHTCRTQNDLEQVIKVNRRIGEVYSNPFSCHL